MPWLQETLAPNFANQDFWAHVVEQHPEFFSRVTRLQEVVRSVVDRAYPEGLSGEQQIQLNMLILTAIGVAEIVTLVGNGMGHGAMKIVRGVMENAIQHGIHAPVPSAVGEVSGMAVG